MHPTDRLHDAARARALELRGQAQQAFWSAIGSALRRFAGRLAGRTGWARRHAAAALTELSG